MVILGMVHISGHPAVGLLLLPGNLCFVSSPGLCLLLPLARGREDHEVRMSDKSTYWNILEPYSWGMNIHLYTYVTIPENPCFSALLRDDLVVDSEVQLLLGGGVKTLVTVGDTWTCVYMLTWQTYAYTSDFCIIFCFLAVSSS